MNTQILIFDKTEINKREFYYRKKPIQIDDVDIQEILISNKAFFYKRGYKYCTGCKDDDYNLAIVNNAAKISEYVKIFHEAE